MALDCCKRPLFLLWAVLVCWTPACLTQTGVDYDDQYTRQDGRGGACYDEQSKAQRCIPEFVNAAFNVRVEATNTCGRPPIEYCMQTGATGAEKLCEICDASSPILAHPPSYLTDFNNNDNLTWWQSETMLQNQHSGSIQYPNNVTLTLHLGKAFDITYVRLKFHSPRPESFAIYKRTSDGGPWTPYQYYSATCRDTYGLPDGNYVTRHNETQALCNSEYSDISPLTGGNVAFSTLEGRPSAYDFENSPFLQEWVTATDIRITLDRLNTFGDEVFRDDQVLQSYYYAISDFAVGGRCKCNGHASECRRQFRYPTSDTQLECACEHNTAGPDCNICLPFYNDQPWGRATAINAHECEACNCNARSEECFFDKDLYARTGHGGHCLNCRHNTDGPNCERCKENYYDRADGICISCNCDKTGSRSLQCDSKGRCACKPGVTGDRCDRCQLNHYDFGSYGCRPCGCNDAGSLGSNPSCDANTGVCRCKENVEGQQCNRCKPGFFNLNHEDEFGCSACFCYGHVSECESDPGYRRHAIESMFGRDRERWVAIDAHSQPIPTQYNAIGQNIAVSAPGRDTVYFSAPDRYLFDQRTSYNQFLSFALRINSSDSRPSAQDIVIASGNDFISQPIYGQRNPSPSSIFQEYRFRLHDHPNYGWTPRMSSKKFMSLLSNITSIKIRATYTHAGIGILDNVKLESASRSGYGPEAHWVEMCKCPVGYLGQFCESCLPGFRHKPANGGPFASCVPCDCHGHADFCDAETGRCMCRHNTDGDHCDRCARGYFGNALKGTATDCQACPCPNQGSCMELLNGDVTCLDCPPGYAGPRCDLCTDGYFGDPQGRFGSTVSCQRCDCNGNIDLNAVGNCNRTTGACLKCIYNTAGAHCDRCLSGFYGDALAAVKGDCKPCNCYSVGTVTEDGRGPSLCNPINGQCQCLPHVTGQRCDVCEDGYWGITSGTGCQSCNCDPVGSVGQSCDIRTGECKCHPGVTGLKCDQCAAYHYGFSITGCAACDCDPIGSRDAHCDARGQCKCNVNVEGRACERCKENKYDKKRGCIDCPPCYNLVQSSANELRNKLKELEKLLNSIANNPGFENDADFEQKLREVMKNVDELLKDAKNAQGADGNIIERLKELRARINEVGKLAGKIDGEIGIAGEDSKEGVRNITEAEEAIKRAKEALKEAQRYLDNEGRDALDKAKGQASKFGQQSDRMKEISREARMEADSQEKQAAEIGQLAGEAFNTSSEAFKIARDAIDKQRDTSDEIRKLRQDLKGADELLNTTKRMAKEALDEATDAYNKSLDIYTEANGMILPDIDVPKMIEHAGDITDEAKKIQEEADSLMKRHGNLMDGLDDSIAEAEQLLKQGGIHQQEADALLAEVDAANAKATKAVEMGDKILEEANNTLETLKGFDKLVRDSKDKAADAKNLIPEIVELITDAEHKTADTRDALMNAENNAGEARRIAQGAQKIAEQSSKDANGIRKEADQTKERAQRLKDVADKQAKEVADAADRLSQLGNQAEEDKDLAQDALEGANEAKINAQAAEDKVSKALGTVNEILEMLNGLKDADKEQLRDLEQRLNRAEKDMQDANMEKRLKDLREARKLQSDWVKDYEAELIRLTADVSNIQAISEALPDGCFKRVVLEP